MTGNNFMIWLLRSPFHGMLSSNMMLITVTGRKTGQKYTLPVNYYGANNSLWVLTSRGRTWWRNVQDGADVSLLLRRQPVHAFAETELETESVERLLCTYLKHIPQGARSMGVRMQNGTPNPDDIERIAKDRLFVRVEPRSNSHEAG
jgi:deazaflavin-dependent oxidoreductase (nitroreductase family)